MPDIAWYDWEELMAYEDIDALDLTGEINTTLPDDLVLELRRAYYSSVSYIDTLVGMVLCRTLTLSLPQPGPYPLSPQ